MRRSYQNWGLWKYTQKLSKLSFSEYVRRGYQNEGTKKCSLKYSELGLFGIVQKPRFEIVLLIFFKIVQHLIFLLKQNCCCKSCQILGLSAICVQSQVKSDVQLKCNIKDGWQVILDFWPGRTKRVSIVQVFRKHALELTKFWFSGNVRESYQNLGFRKYF